MSHRPPLACDVYRVSGPGLCCNAAAEPFRAVCECGHVMAGEACRACLNAKLLGCLTCWKDDRHKCTVRFEEPALTAAEATA